MNNKPVYILSLEASKIYGHMYRSQSINYQYKGMIPFSLELIKLRDQGLTVKQLKRRNNKEISNDIINVTFKSNVKADAKSTLEYLYDKIANLTNDDVNKLNRKYRQHQTKEDYISEYQNRIQHIQRDMHNEYWQEIDVKELRKLLYRDGFTIRQIDRETGEILETKYVVYKRSSSKSRKGECLFIRESLYDGMIKWSRMGIELEKDIEIDLPSLRAYESLVGSAIEDTIKIDPNNILLIDDVESEFKIDCNVIRRDDETEYLDSFNKEETIINSLWDGQSLLDAKYYSDGKSMKLLRNHFFKSAAFNTNIQLYLRDNRPSEIKYENWYIKDMFGRPIKATDIEMITTPSSLKALKYSRLVGTKQDMYEHWIQIVEANGNVFGVVKHEKESKRGYDDDKNILQQMSYQMLNSLPLSPEQVKQLAKHEIDYIDDLKSKIDKFIEHLIDNANTVNSNMMFVDLYKQNSNIVNTQLFRKLRARIINDVVNKVKKGKVRLPGDYAVLFGNPLEMLAHVIGKEIDDPSLQGNEVYTTQFNDGADIVGFRNPHVSPSNVLICKNKKVADIDKYFTLSKSIVCVNAIDNPILDTLNGADYDSDTVFLSNSPILLDAGLKCAGYKVLINRVESRSIDYKLNNEDMAKVDNQLSESQKLIGRVTNLAQLALSRYWDKMNRNKHNDKELLKKIDVLSILSGISIDLAKKLYDIDFKGELENIRSNIDLKRIPKENGKLSGEKKPLFWKVIRGNKKSKNISKPKSRGKNYIKYSCPMDELFVIMSNLDRAAKLTNVDIVHLLNREDAKKGNRKQRQMIEDIVDDMIDNINKIHNKDSDEEDKLLELEEIIEEAEYKVGKFRVKPDTMYAILKQEKYNRNVHLLNILYKTQKTMFLNAFRKVTPSIEGSQVQQGIKDVI